MALDELDHEIEHAIYILESSSLWNIFIHRKRMVIWVQLQY